MAPKRLCKVKQPPTRHRCRIPAVNVERRRSMPAMHPVRTCHAKKKAVHGHEWPQTARNVLEQVEGTRQRPQNLARPNPNPNPNPSLNPNYSAWNHVLSI